MNTTTKSELLSVLTSDLGIDTESNVPENDTSTCVLIDGHALIQALQKPAGCCTFGDYAGVFTKAVFKYFRGITTRVDVVFDQYFGSDSIKASTRSKRSGKKRPIRRVIEGPHVPLPQVWSQFIALEENKSDLASFLSKSLLEQADTLPDGREVVTAEGFEDTCDVQSNIRNVHHLESNH